LRSPSTGLEAPTRAPVARLVVTDLSPAREAAWDAFVAGTPGGSHYHRSGWARVIRNAFGHRPCYRLALRGDVVEGVLPLVAFAHPLFGRSLVSVPFLNRGGVLARTREAQDALLDDAATRLAATRSSFCELRHVARRFPSLPAREDKVSLSLPLEGDPDRLWRAVGPKVRNLVRKAGKAGLIVRAGDPARDLEAFYAVFAENMRDLGTPVYTPRFFREIFREFPRDARLTVVEGDGRAAAAGICLEHGGFAEIHWAASRRAFRDAAPNMLLYWDCIASAARRGRTEFCFGRSTEGSGPYRFKRQWGAEPTRLHWEYLLAPGKSVPQRSPDHPKVRMAVRAWRRLPVAVTRRLGPPIVRHLP